MKKTQALHKILADNLKKLEFGVFPYPFIAFSDGGTRLFVCYRFCKRSLYIFATGYASATTMSGNTPMWRIPAE
jgi:hypothetical protein